MRIGYISGLTVGLITLTSWPSSITSSQVTSDLGSYLVTWPVGTNSTVQGLHFELRIYLAGKDIYIYIYRERERERERETKTEIEVPVLRADTQAEESDGPPGKSAQLIRTQIHLTAVLSRKLNAPAKS